MTNRERIEANNAKIKEIQEIIKNKQLSSNDGEYFVKVIDYDGTILKEARLDTGDTFTLPNAPSHDGLVFQEWSCSQDIVDGVITIEDNNVMVGAVYTTASGLSEFDIEITKAMEADIATNGFVVTLNMDGTKDWGDGASDDLTTHTYTNYGKYTIKCDGTTMTTTNNTYLFGKGANYYCVNVRFANITSISWYAFKNCEALKTITIPKGVTSIGDYVFQSCDSLTSVVIPSGVTSIKSYLFSNCYPLKSITIPKGVTSISSQAFITCYSLTSIAMPDTVTSISDNVFNGCYSLTSIIIPEGVTSIESYLFGTCYSLTSIKMPSSVTSISGNAFKNCYSITTYDFSSHTSVPTSLYTTAFTSINKIAKIIVPDNLYEEWIVSTNWVELANYIYKASEVQ